MAKSVGTVRRRKPPKVQGMARKSKGKTRKSPSLGSGAAEKARKLLRDRKKKLDKELSKY